MVVIASTQIKECGLFDSKNKKSVKVKHVGVLSPLPSYGGSGV